MKTKDIWIQVCEVGKKVVGSQLNLATGEKTPYEMELDESDIDCLVNGYDADAIGAAPLTADHVQKGPQYGRVVELKKGRNRFGKMAAFARVTDLAAVAAKAIDEKSYTTVSPEFWPNFRGNKIYLKALSLLGAAWPAFDGMDPIPSPIALAGLDVAIVCDGAACEDPIPVSIVYPDQPAYKPGQLIDDIKTEEAEQKAKSILDRARGWIEKISWSGRPAPEQVTAMKQVVEDAGTALADPTVTGGEDDASASEFAQGGEDMKITPKDIAEALAEMSPEGMTAFTTALKPLFEPLTAGITKLTEKTEADEARKAVSIAQTFAAEEVAVGRIVAPQANMPAAVALFTALQGVMVDVPQADGTLKATPALDVLRTFRAGNAPTSVFPTLDRSATVFPQNTALQGGSEGDVLRGARERATKAQIFMRENPDVCQGDILIAMQHVTGVTGAVPA